MKDFLHKGNRSGKHFKVFIQNKLKQEKAKHGQKSYHEKLQ